MCCNNICFQLTRQLQYSLCFFDKLRIALLASKALIQISAQRREAQAVGFNHIQKLSALFARQILRRILRIHPKSLCAHFCRSLDRCSVVGSQRIHSIRKIIHKITPLGSIFCIYKYIIQCCNKIIKSFYCHVSVKYCSLNRFLEGAMNISAYEKHKFTDPDLPIFFHLDSASDKSKFWIHWHENPELLFFCKREWACQGGGKNRSLRFKWMCHKSIPYGIPGNTEHRNNLYKHRVYIERTIFLLKDCFGLNTFFIYYIKFVLFGKCIIRLFIFFHHFFIVCYK